MRLVKVLFALLVLLGILLVLIKNTVPVAVDLVTTRFENVPLAVVMIVTIAVGIIVGFAIALSNIFASKAEARAYRAENKRLSSELNSLRNIAIDEGLSEIDNGEE